MGGLRAAARGGHPPADAQRAERDPGAGRLLRAVRIRSGGQTGADRAALDFALARGIPYGGWCPAGGWAEDLATPPGLLARYPALVPTPSVAPAQRTAWNVRDGEATLLVTPDGTTACSSGTQLTAACAREIYDRPLRVVDLSDPAAAEALGRWLATTLAERRDSPFDVNVAGPRESEEPGVYQRTRALLERAWRAAEASPPPAG